MYGFVRCDIQRTAVTDIVSLLILMLVLPNTLEQYNTVIEECRSIFAKKNADYGLSWRVLRLPSLTDQIYIKAKRIRSIEDKGVQRIADPLDDEWRAIVNYCIMALIELALPATQKNTNDNALTAHLSFEEAIALYDRTADATRDLMLAKNHDYGEAWRDMRIASFTDLILTKLLRIKQIEDNHGKTTVSEGVGANYSDILNYAVFALIQIAEQREGNA